MHKLRTYLDLVRFEHTLFALPFAYVGMLLASQHTALNWAMFAWITVAMVGARTGAMALNRLIDHAIDAKNPRTQSRHLPAGLLSRKEVLVLGVVSMACLALAAFKLNPLAVKLLPVAVVFLVGYSYTKRFTWLCHFWMGITIGAAAAGGWIGVSGELTAATCWLWAAVAAWLAGFDILYATMDYDFDTSNRIFSVPARFGIAKALNIAQVCHAVCVLLFVVLGVVAQLSWIYFVGLALIAGVLLYEHRLVSPSNLQKINIAFFQVNVVVSMGMLAIIILEKLLHP